MKEIKDQFNKFSLNVNTEIETKLKTYQNILN
jgi:hypothetical protein